MVFLIKKQTHSVDIFADLAALLKAFDDQIKELQMNLTRMMTMRLIPIQSTGCVLFDILRSSTRAAVIWKCYTIRSSPKMQGGPPTEKKKKNESKNKKKKWKEEELYTYYTE